MTTGAALQGRALALNGAVTLDGNDVAAPDCSVAGGDDEDAGVAVEGDAGFVEADAGFHANEQQVE